MRRSGHVLNQIDCIFRRSKLYRAKWDERHAASGDTYGAMTIRRALETVSEFWQEQASADDEQEDTEDATNSDAHKAKVSARRAAFRGGSESKALRRIEKR